MYIYVIYNIFKIFYLFSISFLTIFSAYVHSVETMQMTYPWNKVGYVNFNTERTNWSGKKKRKAKSMMTSHQFYCLVTPQLSHQSPTDHETLMYSLFARFSTYNNHGDIQYIYVLSVHRSLHYNYAKLWFSFPACWLPIFDKSLTNCCCDLMLVVYK